MEIVQVINHYAPCIGGMEEVARAISERIAKKGIGCRVVCLNKCANSNARLKEREIINGVEIERIPFINLKFYKIAPSVFGKIKDADIVHVHGIGFFSDFLILTKWLHRKKIILHTYGGVFHTKKLFWFKKFYFYIMQKILLRFCDKVIAISRQDYELFSGIVNKNKLELQGIGVDIDSFKSGRKVANSFLYVGRISGNKRIDLALRALAPVLKNIPDAKLQIIGPEWNNLKQELTELAKELGIGKKVIFAEEKSREEVIGEYAKAEYFVSASEYESFGITAVEAMASGCIPLLSKIDAFENILGNELKNMLVDFTDSEKAAEEISKIMEIKEREILRKKLLKISSWYNWEEKVKQLIKEYEILLAGSSC